ncbi:ATP-binding cassette domain-containing protein [Mycoplasma bradburyae]|uniref:ATP-binding cassette domain-containing protein n=1 Tax=Mycoplasma bradburyae TaxID=2963128 RepID=UPI0023412735|nr:ATP-binding cassette domain-containing protein [Mycoplasma bradburyae]MDC4184300.1 ATP-binding cassette domain-containing protein [Mycoplasma bradburyae]
MDKTNYIKFSGVSIKHKKYKDFSVDNINFELYGSEVLMLIGKSGAGKTTLLNSITNNKLVSNGQIIFNDQNLLSLNKNKIRKISRSFGFLDQVPNLILEDYVYENITRNIKKKWWYQIFNFTPLSVLNKVEQVLAKLGLSDHINKLVKDLSGGQKQRVEIAKIFFQKPKLLIIDEPTTGLDYLNSEIVIKEIIALSKEFNAPVIISIHDLEIVKKFGHKILIIQNKTANLISNSDDLNIEEIKRKYDTE